MPRSRAYLSIALAIVLALVSAAPVLGVSLSQLNAHKAAADSARKKAADANALATKLLAETARLDKQIGGLQAQTDALDPKIAETSLRTARLRAEVNALRAQVAAKQADIEKTQAEYKLEQQLLSNRIESTYRQGDWFYLEMLLGSRDIRDLITRTEFVSRIIRSNNDIAAQLSGTKDTLDRAKVILDRTLETTTVKRHEAEVVQSDLLRLQSDRQSKVNAQKTVLNVKATLLADTRANAKRQLALYQAELAESSRIEEALRARGSGSGVYNGVMQWPVAGGSLSSPFGWRMHPIYHERRFHSGIDISRGNGVVTAAANGTVITASYGWGGGYGNHIWIDNGSGIVTTYNHLKDGSFAVQVGSSVRKGDRIADVGSTGASTGPHLHFEVRKNGKPQNPMNYLR